MIKRLCITFLILMIAMMLISSAVEAKNHVKVSGQSVAITMSNKQVLRGKYTPRYRYVKWNKVYGREYPRTGRNAKLTLRYSQRVGMIWNNGKWAAVMVNKNCYFVESASLTPHKPIKAVYTGAQFRRAGAIHWQGKKYTWYSQRVLPGRGLRIPGRHLDRQGFVCDSNDMIVLGSNTANRGKVVPTPFGKYGKVYDTGYVGTHWFDCYVGW